MPAEFGPWRWAAAASIGTSHLRAGTRKQDAYAVKVIADDRLCLIVSDGAGSASHGGQGASLVCRLLSRAFADWFDTTTDMPGEDEILEWIDQLRDHIAVIAERRGLTKRQFAATLVLLVAHEQQLLTLQIGDSALVARQNGEWEALCWPENGEFASTTYFITDDPTPQLHLVRREGDYDAFAAFSDGLDSLALRHAEFTPHERFFDPMIRPVDQATTAGRQANLSAALGRYLDSPAICERTDDDKTLVLVSRA